MIRALLPLVMLAGGIAAPVQAQAETRSLCIFDPAGRSGDYYRFMQDYVLEAKGWGAEIELKPYTDEETAAKDYEAGACDGVVATGVRLQRFNRFPSSIEAIGAFPTYELLGQMVNTIAKYDSAAAKMVSGDHETVGFIPVGAAFLFVRDRNIDTVEELAGKRIATMDYDMAAPTLVEHVGAIMVPADLGSIGPKFNNGDVDACYVSSPVYEPFELWKGLGENGGVLRAPLAQATLQILVNRTKFPEGFGKKSRTHFAERYPEAIGLVKKADASIPDKYWIDVPAERSAAWDEMFLDVRVQLRDSGAYDGTMLSVARKLRCGADSARAECALTRE
ncbi:MAG: hypothetical protein KC912_24260 [Proteobacteria bacterium]|nr:hypothetical protein [Pseudomonadota bacterium]